MDVTHRFTVPIPIDQAWTVLNDLELVSPCFPGAALTSYDGTDFAGLVKVKIGPISLQYAGTGTFLERDDHGHRAVIEANGKDRHGNGTASARTTARLLARGDRSTEVDLVTALTVTGKPAQFGRAMMQKVGDKLVGHFATALEARLTEVPATADQRSPDADAGVESSADLGAESGDRSKVAARGSVKAASTATSKSSRPKKTSPAKKTAAKKAGASKPATSKAATSKAATSKAATSKAATSKAATSKAATSKARTSKATGSKAATEEAASDNTAAPMTPAPTTPAPTTPAQPKQLAAEAGALGDAAVPGSAAPHESARPPRPSAAVDLGRVLLPALLRRSAPYLGAVLLVLVVMRRLARRGR